MGSLRLYAIAINEVRDIFSAPEETATALRAIAADRFAESPPASTGLLSRLGPVFRRAPDAPVIRPGVPSGSDVDALLTGRHVDVYKRQAYGIAVLGEGVNISAFAAVRMLLFAAIAIAGVVLLSQFHPGSTPRHGESESTSPESVEPTP